ncbi:hypothetical protein PACTADRAFT_184824 [Pachysolen tannophilus NRRL Y-2460]|uniref:6-O-methylguanine-DNA methyltransferase n=1 Tax=Pachysolen tannophilus NRRL Y-2460 TaxID=669874 RepID=A0A1E4U3J1_PACTA|nr:hypothetical protein PACTADRAFT_184824 [Pachysolen tannophilus NRRL Y-2460]
MSRHSREETLSFYYAVYQEVQLIPYGKITSYGHIAKLISRPLNSRQVGQALKILNHFNSGEENVLYNTNNVPWWRVVNYKGMISPRENGGMLAQKAKLEEEGVVVAEYEDGSLGIDDSGTTTIWWLPPTEFD